MTELKFHVDESKCIRCGACIRDCAPAILEFDPDSEYPRVIPGAEPGCTKSDTLKIVLDKIRPDKAVMVGDRHHDMQAARDNGLPFVGCQYGYLPHEVDGADIRVARAEDIPRAVKSLIGE